MNSLLEIAAFSSEAALLAAQAGAHRIELCAAYAEGGLSPTEASIRMVKELTKVPVFVMVRPRGGDFIYSQNEIREMCFDMDRAIVAGADGFVLGALTKNRMPDTNTMKWLIDSAGGKPITFHRAFDLTANPLEAMEILIENRVQRILSSGQKKSAVEGIQLLADLQKQAAGRICVMPGAGINSTTIERIRKETNCLEFHASARTKTNSNASFGFGEHVLPDSEEIKMILQSL
jgi:copper homeostasis protein